MQPVPAEAPAEALVRRQPSGRFAKGQSGNPLGGGRWSRQVVELARQHTATAIRQLVEIAQHSKNDRARVMACVALLDRGWGRPPQVVGLAVPGLPPGGEIRLRWPGRAGRLDEGGA